MEETGHGHSRAAWTGVILLLLASTLISLGVFFGWPWANWTGIGVAVLGIGAWYGLNAAGYGGLTAAHERPDVAEGEGDPAASRSDERDS